MSQVYGEDLCTSLEIRRMDTKKGDLEEVPPAKYIAIGYLCSISKGAYIEWLV